MPTRMEEYLFDLRGYTILKQALDREHVREINEWVDALPPLEIGDWFENINVQSYRGIDGINLQNVIEGGEIFERLIDNPVWMELVRHYLGSQQPYINEVFLNIRGPGGFLGVHSGGFTTSGKISSGVQNGQWCVQNLSVIAALCDIGSGDGATVIVPSSHKSDFPHPMQKENAGISEASGQEIEGAIEIHLKAGDAALFNDYLLHGSSARTHHGQRRTLVFRYMPSAYAHRFGYIPSDELLSRLTPERQKIVQPHPAPKKP